MKTRKGCFWFAIWVGGFAAVLLVAVAVFVVIGMVDAPPPDESVLHLADLKAPPPEDNAFPDLVAARDYAGIRALAKAHLEACRK